MNIQIYTDFDDEDLKSRWMGLESAIDVYPQITFDWCSTWWKFRGDSYALRVIVVIDANQNTLAIAPFCIDKHFGINILRSMPINFGDYYSILVLPRQHQESEIYDFLFEYLESSPDRTWTWTRLDQISENSVSLIETLEHRNWISRELTRCPTADINVGDWDEYLEKISSSFRSTVRRKLRKFAKSGDYKLEVIRNWEEFEPLFPEINEIHNMRWIDDFVPEKDDLDKQMWKESIKGAFKINKAVLFLIRNSQEIIAYRLGFLHDDTYYDWHLSHNPKFNSLSPGTVIVALVIQYLIENSISKLDFLAGNYDWKKNWCSNKNAPINYQITSPSCGPTSHLLNWYYHGLRIKLRNSYHALMKNNVARRVSRIILGIKNSTR